MNNTNFANGFNCFCPDCGSFFNVQVKPDDIVVSFCSFCGGEDLFFSIDELLDYCYENGTDPVNFYSAFPLDVPIPNSCTGATPRQTAIILYLIASRHDIPLTVESIAGNCETSREIVKKVFEAFHITEKP